MRKSFELIWNNCLNVIKDNVSIQAYKTWFEPIKPIKLKSNILTIQVPSQFFYEWLEEHYIDLLKKTIRKEIGPDAKLEYSIVMENNNKTNNPYTVKIPAHSANSLKNAPVNVPIHVDISMFSRLGVNKDGMCKVTALQEVFQKVRPEKDDEELSGSSAGGCGSIC